MTAIYLETNEAKLKILPHRGALISSYVLKSNSEDSLFWMPENFDETSSAWPGGGLPFLFPFAGRVWHQGQVCQYSLHDQVFPMPLHGFSWSTKWSVLNQTQNSKSHACVVLTLNSDQNSLQIYPFHFAIQMQVDLHGKNLSVQIKIKHIEPSLNHCPQMPVAVGWHPYFALSPGQNSVVIPASTSVAVTPQGGAGKARTIDEHLGVSPWELPHQDLQSLILSDVSAEPSLLKREGLSSIRQTSGPNHLMQHIVTWTNQPQSFHCIEPWMSLPDAVATPTGCKWLNAGEHIDVWLKLEPEPS